MEAVSEDVPAATTLTTVVELLVGSSFEVAVMVTLPTLDGALQAPDTESIVPALALHVSPLVTPPLAVAVNVVDVPVVRVGAGRRDWTYGNRLRSHRHGGVKRGARSVGGMEPEILR